jgi:hypothetical protein
VSSGPQRDDDDRTHVSRRRGGLVRRDRPKEPTPITHSYGDALLNGRMTAAELDAIRAEILGPIDLAPSSTPPPPGRDDMADREAVLSGSTTKRAATLRERIEARDYAGALRVAEDMLALRPDDDLARRCADDCREMLVRVYQAQVGGDDDLPVVAVDMSTVASAALDQWSGYVLSCIDGSTTVSELVDVCSFPRLDTLRLLYGLVQSGLVRIEKRAPSSRRC